MDIITVTSENLEQEHICCAITNNKDCQVASKKAWLAERFSDGLVFKKGNVRGKCFIEYIPAEKAWCPINAEGYMYIDCLWVSGKFKGQGNSTLLLDECIKDSKEKGKKGLVILSSNKKRPYLAEPKFLKHKGFKVVDKAEPYYELMYLPFEKNASCPKFKDTVRNSVISEGGFVLYYAHQCPFTVKYVPIIEAIAKAKGIKFKTIRFETTEQAQNAPTPFTSYSLFYNGEFVTNDILSDKKFQKIIAEKGLSTLAK
ncbi:GNAT family N-acetyltransferase [Clostridium ganghwense]|uniref:GNAT family N-acetyltransferase n=1 Tax=Clostridium ganghwense TaxID=312089 RepID=A0ABT4CR22_9CLOT|nr:GNAT family N-acetyltransferase [Clostridium ganghwense]MCY6370676.1 GNAT family N-acetyltransferase [Clostridium ganghwense]